MINKNDYIDNFIYNLIMPYIIYLKIILSDDNIYKKIKKNNFIYTEKINLNFLMEIIKKKIESLDK